MTGTEGDVVFSLRGTFKENPNASLCLTFVFSAGACAYLVRIFERPVAEFSGYRFDYFATCIWNIVVTMTTVGYGDVIPVTYGGRCVGMFLCVWGVVLQSLMVETISAFLNFDDSQN